jgi:thioredoxin-dependent peroxiredoxin
VLNIGDPAPDFTLPTADGKSLQLSQLRPSKVVLFFFPKAGPGTCANQAMDFTALATKFAKAGTKVIGISKDAPKIQAKFVSKFALNGDFASDQGLDTCEQYGTWGEKQMYGRTYMSILRTTFLIDGQGKIAAIWPVARIKDHAAMVLTAAQAL